MICDTEGLVELTISQNIAEQRVAKKAEIKQSKEVIEVVNF